MSPVPSFSPHSKDSMVQSILMGLPVITNFTVPVCLILSIAFTYCSGLRMLPLLQYEEFLRSGKKELKETVIKFLFPFKETSPIPMIFSL